MGKLLMVATGFFTGLLLTGFFSLHNVCIFSLSLIKFVHNPTRGHTSYVLHKRPHFICTTNKSNPILAASLGCYPSFVIFLGHSDK